MYCKNNKGKGNEEQRPWEKEIGEISSSYQQATERSFRFASL